jgi:hypothetical protein
MTNYKTCFATLRNTDLATTGTSLLQHKLRVFLASYERRAFINSGHILSLSEITDYYPAMGGTIIVHPAPPTGQLRNSTPLNNKGLKQTRRLKNPEKRRSKIIKHYYTKIGGEGCINPRILNPGTRW